MNFRIATESDLKEIKALFVATIEFVCSKDYDEFQIKAWTSSINDSQRWQEMIANQLVILSIIDYKIVGFGTLKNNYYIDLFYIHKDFQNQGIATKLLEKLESEARILNTKTIISDISITAKPFFESKGFTVVQKQEIERNGIVLVNYKMEKQL